MSRFLLSRFAEEDLDEVIAYLGSLPLEPGNRVGGAIRHTLESIGKNPMLGVTQSELSQVGGYEVRSRVVPPYRIFYRLAGRAPEVLGILHGARDVDAIMLRRVH